MFTWDNGRDNAHNVKQRIDRATANIDWIELFPEAIVIH